MRNTRILLVALIAAVAMLPTCSRGNDVQVAQLQTEVDALHTQVDQLGIRLDDVHQRLTKAETQRRSLQRCMVAVSNASAEFSKAQSYSTSDRVGMPFTYSVGFKPCDGVLSTSRINALRKEVVLTHQAVRQIHGQRKPDEPPPAPSNVTAICNDGSCSYSQNASGTCSWHGGVGTWVNYPG